MFREKKYMITGVMIASATTSFREILGERGIYIHAGVDAPAWNGVPFSAGPEGKWKRKNATTESSVRIEDFLFAFRVREFRVKRKGGVKAHKMYDKGALFNTDLKGVTKEEVDLELIGLGGDVDVGALDMESTDVKQGCVEGDDGVGCGMPEDF